MTRESSTQSESLTSLDVAVNPVYVTRANQIILASSPASESDQLARANALVDRLAVSSAADSYTCFDQTILLSAVLRAMIRHAKDCGGDQGHRWTISRVLACEHDENKYEGGTIKLLRYLGIAWLTHFLFLCE
jgi:hypothetical protein